MTYRIHRLQGCFITFIFIFISWVLFQDPITEMQNAARYLVLFGLVPISHCHRDGGNGLVSSSRMCGRLYWGLQSNTRPSKHARSNLHPLCIGLEVLARSRPDYSCTLSLVCFQTRSVWLKPDSQPEPNWIQAGFAHYNPDCLWKNISESESGKLVVGWKNISESESGKLVVGWLHSARTGPDDSCTLVGQNLTSPFRPDLGRICTMTQAFFGGCGKSDLACTIWLNSGCKLVVMVQ